MVLWRQPAPVSTVASVLSHQTIIMGRSEGSHNESESPKEDTIVVKRENSADDDLAEDPNLAKIANLKHDSSSRSNTPQSASTKLKQTQRVSTSTPRPKSENDDAAVKSETDSMYKAESPIMPPSTSKKARNSKKPPPRVAPLFDHLPDATEQANSSYTVIDSCTYQNKYLGFTEHAMECDCQEEWGEFATLDSSFTR